MTIRTRSYFYDVFGDNVPDYSVSQEDFRDVIETFATTVETTAIVNNVAASYVSNSSLQATLANLKGERVYAKDKGIFPTNTGDQNARAWKAYLDSIATETSIEFIFEPASYDFAGSFGDLDNPNADPVDVNDFTETLAHRILPKTLKKFRITAKGAVFNQVQSIMPNGTLTTRVLFDLVCAFDDMLPVAYDVDNTSPKINTTVVAGKSLDPYASNGELSTTTAITLENTSSLSVDDIIRVCPLNLVRQVSIGATPGTDGNAYNGGLARIARIEGNTLILDRKLYDFDEFVTDVHIAKYNPCAIDFKGMPHFQPSSSFDNSQTGQGDGTDGYLRIIGSLFWDVEISMENAPANGFAYVGCAFGSANVKARNFPDRPANQGSAQRVGYPIINYQSCWNRVHVISINSRHAYTTRTGSFVGALSTKGGIMPASVKNQGNILGAAGFGRSCYDTVTIKNQGGVEASVDVHDGCHHIYFVNCTGAAAAIRDNTIYNTTERDGQFRGDFCAAINCHFNSSFWFETSPGRFDVNTFATGNMLLNCTFTDVGGRPPITIKNAVDVKIWDCDIENSETAWLGHIVFAEGNATTVDMRGNIMRSKSYKNASVLSFRDNASFVSADDTVDVSHQVKRDVNGTLRTINASKDIIQINGPTAATECEVSNMKILAGLNSYGELVSVSGANNDNINLSLRNIISQTKATKNATHNVYEAPFVDYTSSGISFEDDGGTYYIRDEQLGLLTQGLAVGAQFTLVSTGAGNVNDRTYTITALSADEMEVTEAVTTQSAVDAKNVTIKSVVSGGLSKLRFIGINRFGTAPALFGGNTKPSQISFDGFKQFSRNGDIDIDWSKFAIDTADGDMSNVYFPSSVFELRVNPNASALTLSNVKAGQSTGQLLRVTNTDGGSESFTIANGSTFNLDYPVVLQAGRSVSFEWKNGAWTLADNYYQDEMVMRPTDDTTRLVKITALYNSGTPTLDVSEI